MPKIIGTTLADHRELIRRRLFNALGALLAEEPFDAITMSRIAQKAGVGRTAVYNHFADKEVLLLAYMRQVTTGFTEVLRRRLDEEPDPVRRLRVYLRAHMEMTDRYHLMSGVALRKHMSQENSSHLRDHAGVVGGVLLSILDDAVAEGAIPAQNTLGLVHLIHSAMAGQRLPRDPQERGAALRMTEAFILRAVGVPEKKVAEVTSEGPRSLE